MITEDYCDFETSKLLKEKGFDEKCRAYYKVFPESRIAAIYYSSENRGVSEDDPNEILCPTLQMAMKWLREVHYLHITAHPVVSRYGFVWTYAIVFAKEVGEGETHSYKINQITTPIVKSKSCEQACEAAVKYCLENLI